VISGKDLEGWINAPNPLAAMESTQNQAYYRDRRERIATAVLTGMLANQNVDPWRDKIAVDAVFHADALIAELDKPKKVQP
jgi:hypothetical protein